MLNFGSLKVSSFLDSCREGTGVAGDLVTGVAGDLVLDTDLASAVSRYGLHRSELHKHADIWLSEIYCGLHSDLGTRG